jgi:YD repeat-containing protein
VEDTKADLFYFNITGILEFNRSGQLTQIALRDTFGVIKSRLLFEFDHNGLLIAERNLENDSIESSSIIYTYDSANRLSSETDYIYGEENESFYYHYDEVGRMVLKKRFSWHGDLKSMVECSYDEMGRQTVYKQIYPNGDLVRQDVFIHDQSGKLVKQIYTGSTDTLGAFTSYEYDEDAKLIRRCYYDDEVNCRSCRHFSRDKFGNINMEADYLCDSTLVEMFKYYYIYEERGNWIEKRFYAGAICNAVIEATYTYY